jgi:hypothetical protein
MTKMTTPGSSSGEQEAATHWTDPNLPASRFLHERKGPWPQPAPDFPMSRPPEVLNIPQVETEQWENTIGARYLYKIGREMVLAPPRAKTDLTLSLPDDAEFVRIMTQTVYARFLRQPDPGNPGLWVSDFTVMELISPLPQTYCAPVTCQFAQNNSNYSCISITFLPTPTRTAPLVVLPSDKAWNLAKVYACQGAAYHSLFVVHPALHFPMDAVNAITKTAVPKIHPLFQALYPHTTYTLTQDNAVLEGANSIVSNDPPDSPFDPLTAEGTNLKQLFGVGYSGYKGMAAYPRYSYLQPWMDTRTLYGGCLNLYFAPFLAFATKIAAIIPNTDPYVARWADYCSTQVLGFPGASTIFQGDNLARAIAVYLWDVSVAHGADHYSFAYDISVTQKCLRIRRAPPVSTSDGGDVQKVGDIANLDDLTRAEIASAVFFSVVTLDPNLVGTTYKFSDPGLQGAVSLFHQNLAQVDTKVREAMQSFIPLQSDVDIRKTISASIQF